MFLWADASDLDHLPCYARFLECAQVRGQGESACAISVGQARQARRHGRRSTLRINAEVSRACVQAYARVAVITILLSLNHDQYTRKVSRAHGHRGWEASPLL